MIARARIVKTLVLSVLSFIHKSFTSSASFWESKVDVIAKLPHPTTVK
ncbi:hypothetical protein Tco_0427097, partial [Tanacetum coccineum]